MEGRRRSSDDTRRVIIAVRAAGRCKRLNPAEGGVAAGPSPIAGRTAIDRPHGSRRGAPLDVDLTDARQELRSRHLCDEAERLPHHGGYHSRKTEPAVDEIVEGIGAEMSERRSTRCTKFSIGVEGESTASKASRWNRKHAWSDADSVRLHDDEEACAAAGDDGAADVEEQLKLNRFERADDQVVVGKKRRECRLVDLVVRRSGPRGGWGVQRRPA
jgi:hypothetical protein